MSKVRYLLLNLA